MSTPATLSSRDFLLSFFTDTSIIYAGFVSDFDAERECVDERLQNATDEPTTVSQHFWLDGHHAHTLATLKDRVWRGTLLLEACRSTLIRINANIFPTGPQPQGILALLGLFRSVYPIRDFVTEKLILATNATMAYIRSQHPQLSFRPSEAGTVLSQQNMDGTFESVRLIAEHYHDQLVDLVLHVKDEIED